MQKRNRRQDAGSAVAARVDYDSNSTRDTRGTYQSIRRRIGAKKSGKEYIGRCPAHDDRKPSLSITIDRRGVILLRCHAGCLTEEVVAVLGHSMSDLFPRPSHRSGRPILREHSYLGEDGRLLFKTVKFVHDSRYETDWSADRCVRGEFRSGMGNARRVLYNLPSLLKSEGRVAFTEGEDDADALMALDLTATTVPFSSWKNIDPEPLRGRDVDIFADNDSAGEKRARSACEQLHSVAGSLRLVNLPNVKQGRTISDVRDFINAGGTRGELEILRENAPLVGSDGKPLGGGKVSSYPRPFAPRPIPEDDIRIIELTGDVRGLQAILATADRVEWKARTLGGFGEYLQELEIGQSPVASEPTDPYSLKAIEIVSAAGIIAREELVRAMEGRKERRRDAIRDLIESGILIPSGSGEKGDPQMLSLRG